MRNIEFEGESLIEGVQGVYYIFNECINSRIYIVEISNIKETTYCDVLVYEEPQYNHWIRDEYLKCENGEQVICCPPAENDLRCKIFVGYKYYCPKYTDKLLQYYYDRNSECLFSDMQSLNKAIEWGIKKGLEVAKINIH